MERKYKCCFKRESKGSYLYFYHQKGFHSEVFYGCIFLKGGSSIRQKKLKCQNFKFHPNKIKTCYKSHINSC